MGKSKKNQGIYISGKISGLNILDAKIKFRNAEKELIDMGYFHIINPINLHSTSDLKTWEQYMIVDIEALFKCDAIYMLKDWGDSKGARVEVAIAKELGLKIIYQ